MGGHGVGGRGDDEEEALGDEAIFRALYSSLRRFAAGVGPREIEPDDLVQEAVTRTLARRRLSELDDPERYLRRVIVNLATSGLRRRRPWERARSRIAQSDQVLQPVPSDLADLDQLSPVDRAVMWLVFVEGHTHREAAEMLGISEQASRSRASRSRVQLKHSIRSEEVNP
jgi:RNA polymerase sigma factor (sigma-70 family)